jgi:hypothetical protein
VQLTYPSDAVVVVAGVPGAGKTTLIRRAVDPATVRIVDTEDRRDAGRAARRGCTPGTTLGSSWRWRAGGRWSSIRAARVARCAG